MWRLLSCSEVKLSTAYIPLRSLSRVTTAGAEGFGPRLSERIGLAVLELELLRRPNDRHVFHEWNQCRYVLTSRILSRLSFRLCSDGIRPRESGGCIRARKGLYRSRNFLSSVQRLALRGTRTQSLVVRYFMHLEESASSFRSHGPA